jgi:predicted O-methyltransferase YrrM
VIDLNHCNEWQHRDPETGLVFPWYTKSFLDELVTWELGNKQVLEVGAGASTIWWVNKAAYVTTFETDPDWYDLVEKHVSINACNIFLPKKGRLIQAMEDEAIEGKYDIAIVDCDPVEFRDQAALLCIKLLKPGGKLIIDNWMQPSVGWMPSEEMQLIVTSMPHVIYPQADHPDWKTLVATKL